MAKTKVARPRPPFSERRNLLQIGPRSRADILQEYDRWWDKVWWNRHMSHHTPGHDCSDESMIGCDGARIIVDKYGLEFLEPGDDLEWGIATGKMMALAWACGSDWDSSGDT